MPQQPPQTEPELPMNKDMQDQLTRDSQPIKLISVMINHPCKFLCSAYFIAFICTFLSAHLDLFNLSDFKNRDWLIRDDPIVNDLDRWDGLDDYIEEKRKEILGISESDDDYYYEEYYYGDEEYYYDVRE